MEREFMLKVYMPNAFKAVTLPESMFPTKIQRENAEIARTYLDDNCPKWRKAVFITKGSRTAQRCVIYPMNNSVLTNL
jgi:hypothetical protein